MPATPPPKRRLLRIALGVIALGAGGFLAWSFLGRDGAGVSFLHGGRSAAGETWPRYVIEALSLEAPFAFGSGPDVSSRLPEEVRQMIVSWKTREGIDPATGLRVQVSHIVYRDTVNVDLDGALGGAMTEAAAALGDHEPDYTASATEISGLPARRATYRRTRPALQIDALFLQRGPHLWQVQALSNSKAARPLGERILDSVQLATSPDAPPPESQTPATAR